MIVRSPSNTDIDDGALFSSDALAAITWDGHALLEWTTHDE